MPKLGLSRKQLEAISSDPDTIRQFEKLFNSVIPIGSLTAFCGESVPDNWLIADGSAISRTIFSSLFGIIGTIYGVGDGSTTFNLPDCRGIFLRGSGQNSVLTKANGDPFSYTIGDYSNDQIQGHAHDLIVDNPPTAEGVANSVIRANSEDSTGASAIGNLIEISTYGVPRVSNETAPACLPINYIIKYR